jgi:hypothetical protein
VSLDTCQIKDLVSREYPLIYPLSFLKWGIAAFNPEWRHWGILPHRDSFRYGPGGSAAEGAREMPEWLSHVVLLPSPDETHRRNSWSVTVRDAACAILCGFRDPAWRGEDVGLRPHGPGLVMHWLLLWIGGAVAILLLGFEIVVNLVAAGVIIL